MSFKTGQKVRIKGTEIEGTYQGTNGYGIPHVEGTYANGFPDYCVPASWTDGDEPVYRISRDAVVSAYGPVTEVA